MKFKEPIADTFSKYYSEPTNKKAVWLKSEKDFDDFCKELDKRGFDSETITYAEYENETAVEVMDNILNFDKFLEYGKVVHFLQDGCTIVAYKREEEWNYT